MTYYVKAFATNSVGTGYGSQVSFTTLGPEINITGNGNNISSGDVSPSITDGTDFGSVAAASGTISHNFVIQNTGTATLTLTGSSPYATFSGTNSDDFSVTSVPSNSIVAGGQTTLQITFDPSGIGLRTATVSIANDDSDENPYTFSIRGTGANSAPVATAPTWPLVYEDDVNVALADNIQVTDADGDPQTLTFTITGGTVTLGTTGITFGGGGNGSASFTAYGTLAAINTALDAATFTPTPNHFGDNAATIAFVSNDGTDNSNNATVTFDIIAVNDPPTLTATGNNPTFIEDGPAADLYSAVTISTIESWHTIIQLVLTVTNVIRWCRRNPTY
jgi:hypothetical protein